MSFSSNIPSRIPSPVAHPPLWVALNRDRSRIRSRIPQAPAFGGAAAGNIPTHAYPGGHTSPKVPDEHSSHRPLVRAEVERPAGQ